MVVDTSRVGATGKDRWQAKSLRSTFGNQCMSQLPTSPSCGFGSAIREATDKVCSNGERRCLQHVRAIEVDTYRFLHWRASLGSQNVSQPKLVCICRHMCLQMWTEQTADLGEATILRAPSTKARSALYTHHTLQYSCCLCY